MFRRRDRGQAPETGAPLQEAAPIPLHNDTEPGPSPGSSAALRRQNGKWKVVVSLLAIGFFFFMALEWREVVVWVEGRWELTPERTAERERQLKKPNQFEANFTAWKCATSLKPTIFAPAINYDLHNQHNTGRCMAKS